LWRWLAKHFDARCLVFVDESGFHTSMMRLRARAPRGERAYGKVPRNRGKNTTLIASITLEGGMGEAMTIEGATDALAFEAYVEHFLAPTLAEGQVVVLDRLAAHRTEKVRELVEARGRRVAVPAILFAGSQPDRSSVLEDKEARQEGRRAHARSVGGGHRRGTPRGHGRRRRRMVRALRLRATGSMLMNTAVSSEDADAALQLYLK